jgi:hypothetical protein
MESEGWCIVAAVTYILLRESRIPMEHFRIVQTLCRIGLGAENPAFRFQVERLAQALRDSGDAEEAVEIDELLKTEGHDRSMKPSRIVASRQLLSGEELTVRVGSPVDRETGAPLAEIHFPVESSRKLVFDEVLGTAVERVMEEWVHADRLEELGASPPRACMLFGKPGTGKTKLGYWLAERLGLPLVIARLDGLMSSFLGTTARNIGSLFDFANRYRCVLLLDEFDALAKLRDDPQEVGEIKRVVNAVLQNLDRRATTGFTVAITNHEGLLDPAVWRRFEVRIHVPVPEYGERREILRQYLEPVAVEDSTLRVVATISEGMTGGDLEAMARSVKRFIAIHGGNDTNFIDALRAYAITHATANKEVGVALLLEEPQKIARMLLSHTGISVTQGDVGDFLGKDQATISRWMKADSGRMRRSTANA